MDISHLLTQAGEIAAGGTGVFLATHIVKASENIPWITPENVMRVRACAAVLSAVAVLISKWADGGLDTASVQNVIQALLAFAGTWALAHGINAGVNKATK